MVAAGAEQPAVCFNHVAKHVRDIGKQFTAVGTAVGGGGVEVKVGFVVKLLRALGTGLGKADDETRSGRSRPKESNGKPTCRVIFSLLLERLCDGGKAG